MKLTSLLLAIGFISFGCTASEKKFEQNTIASIRSAALMLKGGLQAVRDNAATEEEVLAIAKTLVPPGSDLSKLDDEAQALVTVIQTSSDKQLIEIAATKLVAKLK